MSLHPLVVLYLYSTSNHNNFFSMNFFSWLFYTSILHQTTTECHFQFLDRGCFIPLFYIKPQRPIVALLRVSCCFIPLFYIKPQHEKRSYELSAVVLYLYSTSNHNDKIPQHDRPPVVLYLYSTSNHNWWAWRPGGPTVVLYLYSTSNHNCKVVQ